VIAEQVLARRDKVVNNLDDGSQVNWALSSGIDVIRGTAQLSGVRAVTVTMPDGSERVITARHAVVIDTGSSASVPPIPGLSAALPWISRDATNIHQIPRRIAIIGGGVVACESATWLRGLGVEQVTMLVREDRLLTNSEDFAGELVAEQFTASGVDLRFGVTTTQVNRMDPVDSGVGHIHGGKVFLTLDDGSEIETDEILVAAGRHPNSSDIGLESIGATSGGFIDVDDQLTVSGVEGEWLYAIGDVIGRALLTHMGKYQARIVGEVIAARAAGTPLDTSRYGRHVDRAGRGKIPQVTFTHPEVGSAGLTEQAARAAAIPVLAVEYDLAGLAGTYVFSDDYRGRAKLVLDTRDDTVVGTTFVGTGIAELTHSAMMAVIGGFDLDMLWHSVPSYPTISEVWLRLLEEVRSARHGQV
jgi:pyruvate/2-oxoglutarate dehydrogenase complex dihydrolipoamide dehydrogenase (E3) component